MESYGKIYTDNTKTDVITTKTDGTVYLNNVKIEDTQIKTSQVQAEFKYLKQGAIRGLVITITILLPLVVLFMQQLTNIMTMVQLEVT